MTDDQEARQSTNRTIGTTMGAMIVIYDPAEDAGNVERFSVVERVHGPDLLAEGSPGLIWQQVGSGQGIVAGPANCARVRHFINPMHIVTVRDAAVECDQAKITYNGGLPYAMSDTMDHKLTESVYVVSDDDGSGFMAAFYEQGVAERYAGAVDGRPPVQRIVVWDHAATLAEIEARREERDEVELLSPSDQVLAALKGGHHLTVPQLCRATGLDFLTLAGSERSEGVSLLDTMVSDGQIEILDRSYPSTYKIATS